MRFTRVPVLSLILAFSAHAQTTPPPTAEGAEAVIERARLENGISLLVMHVPGAPKQWTFTFLPLHLLNDAAGRTQWAHLVEHHLIRSTDPDSLHGDGYTLNGETMDSSMRLESMSDPERWSEVAKKHAAWLEATEFSAEVHERELFNIAAEEEGTSRAGATLKWALAAWNQIVRHGRDHAAVHGAVADSKLEDVEAYVRAHVPIGSEILVATVGPVKATEAIAALREAHSGLGMRSVSMPQAEAPRFGDEMIEATWDLPVAHVMRWWTLPPDSAETTASLQALGLVLQMRLSQYPELRQLVHMIAAHPGSETPDGRFLIVNASLKEGADAAQVLRLIDDVFETTTEPAPAVRVAANIARALGAQLRQIPDFDAARRQAPEHLRDRVEGQWFLRFAQTEFATGMTVDELCTALEAITEEDLRSMIDAMSRGESGSLYLTPAEEENGNGDL